MFKNKIRLFFNKNRVFFSFLDVFSLFFIFTFLLGYFSTGVKDVSKQVIRDSFWSSRHENKLEYMSLFVEKDQSFQFSNSWDSFANEMENYGKLEFAISKVFNYKNNNSFKIVNEIKSINDTHFTVLDTNTFVDNPVYSSMHVLTYPNTNDWSKLNLIDNSIYIGKDFANYLLIARGYSINDFSNVIGEDIQLLTPNGIIESFVISGITYVTDDNQSTSGHIFDIFDENVFFISHRKSNEYQSNILFSLFRTLTERKTLFYYDLIMNFSNENVAAISYTSNNLNEIVNDYYIIQNNHFLKFIGYAVLLLSFIIFIFISYRFNKFLTILSPSKKNNFTIDLHIMTLIFAFTTFLSVIILNKLKFLNYSVPALNRIGLNFIVIFAITTFLTNLFIGYSHQKKAIYLNCIFENLSSI